MFEVGDRVWVKVSDMKDRGGTVTEISDEKLFCDLVYVTYDSGQYGDWQSVDNVFPMSPRVADTTEQHIAKKNDKEKNRLELIPISGIEGIGRAMTFGATKYSAHNWANGFDWLRLCGSTLRHLTAWMSGQDKDPESGLSHLDHLGACVVMLIAHETEGLGNDNRRKRNS